MSVLQSSGMDDWEKAREDIMAELGNVKELRPLLHKADAEARKLVRGSWRYIRAVAAALLERWSLSYDEVVEIMDRVDLDGWVIELAGRRRRAPQPEIVPLAVEQTQGRQS